MGAPVTFRAGVVGVIRRSDGQVLVFERADVPGAWQFPQGGLDRGEQPLEAAWREVAEETGLGPDRLVLEAEHADWLAYELPAERRGPKAGLGQVQRWFLFRVTTDHVEPTPDGHEFVAWRWATPAWILDHVVEFRRPAYRAALGALLPHG